MRNILRKVAVYGVGVITVVGLLRMTHIFVQEKENNPEKTDKINIRHQRSILLEGENMKSTTTSQHRLTVKTILTWNHLYSSKDFDVEGGQNVFKKSGCKVTNCEIWHRLVHELTLPHDGYDAVVFHGIANGDSNVRDLPLKRSTHQRYVFYLFESPVMRPYIYNMKNFFNWTATYRRDSDISIPNFSFKSKSSGKLTKEWITPAIENISHIPESITNKTKLVAWFTTNRYTQSRREKLVKRLSLEIPIDIFGENEKLKCPRSRSVECDLMLQRDYKFYLAFENSLCDEYITEKLRRPLQYNTVPIVYGGANYFEFLPPYSYIDVKDFNTTSLLAEYLRYLDKNPVEYFKYFWWKDFYTVQEPKSFWCDLCEKLNNASEPKRVYPDIEAWWIYPNVCQSPGKIKGLHALSLVWVIAALCIVIIASLLCHFGHKNIWCEGS